MNFTKMHGIGNDYVYVNGFAQTIADPARLAIEVSNRHTGVGADGLILVLPSRKADVRMRMFNADGGEAEMCGNGVRCLAKFAYENGLSKKNPMTVETGRGLLSLRLQVRDGKVRQVTVNMAAPILTLVDIPVKAARLTAGKHPHEHRFSIGRSDEVLEATFVSMGNPHAVIFVRDIQKVDLQRLGPLVEKHPAFPKRINAHWVQVNSKGDVTMATWERGSGITLACGTGACAVCVAGVLTGRTDRKIVAHLPGGDLRLDWSQHDNNVYMSGPAAEAFSGQWNGT